NNVSVLLGNGDGTLQPAVNFPAGTEPWNVQVGDFNNDGKPDLVVANNGSNNVSILLGNGDGTFQSAVNYNTGQGPIFTRVADLNGDNKLDLVVANFAPSANSISVLMGNGDGTFQSSVIYPTNSFASVSIVAVDFNRDSKVDLAVANELGGNVS